MLIKWSISLPSHVDYWTHNDKHILSSESNLFQTRIFLVSVLWSTPKNILLEYRYPHYCCDRFRKCLTLCLQILPWSLKANCLPNFLRYLNEDVQHHSRIVEYNNTTQSLTQGSTPLQVSPASASSRCTSCTMWPSCRHNDKRSIYNTPISRTHPYMAVS